MQNLKLSFLFFVSCFLFPFQGHSAPRIQLEIWTASENVKRALDTLVKPFEKDYQARVRVTVLNRELTTQFQTAGLSGKGPDILIWAHDVVGELATSGLIEPIALPPHLRAALVDSALDAFTYDGRLFGYPFNVESVAFIRNPDILSNLPKSLEELKKEAQKISKQNTNHYGFLYDVQNFFFSFPILAAGKGVVFESDELGRVNPQRPGLASKEMIENANFLQRLVRSGVLPASTDRSIAFEMFTAGRLGAMIDGPWAIRDLIRSQVPFIVSPIPQVNGLPARPFLGGQGFMIRRSSPQKLLAKELVENYLVTAEGIAELYRQDPRTPARQDSLALLKEELSAQQLEILNAFIQSAENALPMPNIPEMGAVWPAMGQALNFILNQNRDPAEVLKQTVRNLVQETK